MITRYSALELIEKKIKKAFFNVRGWKVYFTLEPTVATPTGKLWKSGFPRVVRILSETEIKPTKLINI